MVTRERVRVASGTTGKSQRKEYAMDNLETAIKSLAITDETVLFVDIDQIPVRVLEKCESLPKNLLIVGVVGSPNIEAMTEQELQSILDRKRSLRSSKKT